MAGKPCGRCAGKKKEATVVRRLALDQDRYELDLCDEHARLFDRDIGAWLRVAEELTPEVRQAFSEASRERQIDLATKHMFAPKPPPDTSIVVVQKLPAAYHLWGLTEHAKQRCEERGISQRNALLCAADPKVAYPDKETGYWIHKRDGWNAIVNRNTKMVITVMPDSLLAESSKEVEAVRG